MPKVKLTMKKRRGLFKSIEGTWEIEAASVSEMIEIKEKIGGLHIE